MPCSILIVDDSPVIRRLLRSCVEKNIEWQVCGEAENGKEAVDKVKELRPNVVILDLQMPVMNGLEAARQITTLAPDSVMVMFTMHDTGSLRSEAHAAGIRDVVSKTDHFTERLVFALKNALESSPGSAA